MTTFRKKFEAFGDVNVLVVGDLMLDRYLSGKVDRISPEAPVPVVAVSTERSVAGGAANVASNVKGLGASCEILGIIGNDGDGIELRSICEKAGIGVSGAVVSNSRPTTVKSRLVSDGHQIARFDKEEAGVLSSEDSEELLSCFRSLVADTDVVLLSDYGKGVLSSGVCEAIIDASKSANKDVFVDPKGFDYERYSGATVVTPNLKEAIEAAHRIKVDDDDVGVIGREVLSNFDFGRLLITRGADGMSLFGNDGSHFRVASSARKVYDVTGAGDTVIATLAVAHAAGIDLKEAVSLANSAAGIVVESVGTTAIRLERLKDYLEANSEREIGADV